jgi:hypothetical protein
MAKRFKLAPLVILGIVCFVIAGELIAGTDFYFVSMASIALVCACITYNIVGGVGTIAGFGFSGFAVSTIVVSQIGKAGTLERADQNLDAPHLTITVYAVYFFALMVGAFVFSRVRLRLPKPAEPETPTQSHYLYIFSLAGGLIAAIGGLAETLAGGAAIKSFFHGVYLVLGYLLPFSLVLAVDARIRSTSGRHSFGWLALWPTLAMELEGFIYASRQGFVEPVAIIFLTCYFRGFKFRRKHFAAVMALGAAFFLFVSPYYLYSRGWRVNPTIGELASTMWRVLQSAPDQWQTIKANVGNAALASPGAVNYFDTPGAVTLNRFALVGPDSTLIGACSTGYHYGFTSLELDALSEVPRFLYPGKPDAGSGKFLGHLDGQEPDELETTHTTITPIADSFGAFSWLGVVVFPFFVIPAIFVVYESFFDISRPWGSVAAVQLIFTMVAGSMGDNIIGVLIKTPVYIVGLSWGVMWLVRMIPATGDRAVRSIKLGASPSAIGVRLGE